MNAARWCLPVAVAALLLAPAGPPAHPVDFVHDVLPLLQRQGCSSAYCHGSATGRAGFKLSLFGSEPGADFAAITTALGGRRVDLRDPEHSLLVQKALGRLDHGGGRRVPRDSASHRALVEWIAAGAPWCDGPAQTLAGLELAQQGERLEVRATFATAAGAAAGAEIRDVTALALFSSTDPTVVEVDADGALCARGPGLAHVAARYGNRTALLRWVRPFAPLAPAAAAAAAHPLDSHLLDRAWHAHLRELGLVPAARVDADRLLRRLTMDLVGRPPTPHELDAFAARPDVEATVAALLARPEFAVVWGEHLARWFEVEQPSAQNAMGGAAAGARTFAARLRRGEALSAIAAAVVDGSLGRVEQFQDPRDRAEYVGRTLLGVRIGCARCHDHPLDRWRRSEHLAFSACFASPRPDGAGGTTAGMLFDPEGGDAVAPRLPALGLHDESAPGADRRAAVRAFVLAEDHDQLARNLTNRVFAELLGRGLVEPVDDHRLGNPPRCAAMLDALVAQYHSSGGSLAALVAFVATSAIYAADLADDGAAAHLLAARTSQPLRPAAFARAVAAVLGSDGAPELPATGLARELELQNGSRLPALLAAGGTAVDAIFDTGVDAQERLRELWRTVLSRAPRKDEAARFAALAADRLAFRDLAQALLTGREFGYRR